MDASYVFVLIIIAIGMGGGLGMWYFIDSVGRREKDKIRGQYMELIKEKLEVIKTALAMGHSDSQVKDLDRRLEKLIGTEKMLETLSAAKAEEVSKQAMQSGDLIDEAELMRKAREKPDLE